MDISIVQAQSCKPQKHTVHAKRKFADTWKCPRRRKDKEAAKLHGETTVGGATTHTHQEQDILDPTTKATTTNVAAKAILEEEATKGAKVVKVKDVEVSVGKVGKEDSHPLNSIHATEEKVSKVAKDTEKDVGVAAKKGGKATTTPTNNNHDEVEREARVKVTSQVTKSTQRDRIQAS